MLYDRRGVYVVNMPGWRRCDHRTRRRFSQSGARVRKKGTQNPPDDASVGGENGQLVEGCTSGGESGGMSPERPGPPGAERPGDAFGEAAGERTDARTDAGLECAPVRGLDGTSSVKRDDASDHRLRFQSF